MARSDHQNDDDDFMDPPQQNQVTGRRKEGNEKRTRNRASQERLTSLTDSFTDDQKGAATEMGMRALMNVRCTNLVNPVCDWLGEIYDPRLQGICDFGMWKTAVERGIRVLHFGCAPWTNQSSV